MKNVNFLSIFIVAILSIWIGIYPPKKGNTKEISTDLFVIKDQENKILKEEVKKARKETLESASNIKTVYKTKKVFIKSPIIPENIVIYYRSPSKEHVIPIQLNYSSDGYYLVNLDSVNKVMRKEIRYLTKDNPKPSKKVKVKLSQKEEKGSWFRKDNTKK